MHPKIPSTTMLKLYEYFQFSMLPLIMSFAVTFYPFCSCQLILPFLCFLKGSNLKQLSEKTHPQPEGGDENESTLAVVYVVLLVMVVVMLATVLVVKANLVPHHRLLAHCYFPAVGRMQVFQWS
mmetsp:Transcript_4472/g.8593  ORF Transcript_4472/g.8593 Transcript_4472/m.8593 type:complete len:124 (-) Transcript_4472:886-1257(-)